MTTEGANQSVDATVINTLYNRVTAVESTAHTKMLNNAMELVQYGDNNYLPVPAAGAFVASASATLVRCMCYFPEASGKLVILRNGKDLVSDGVYYSYADLSYAGEITNYTPTIAPYTPAFLSAGESVTKAIHNTDQAMLVEVMNASGVRTLRFVQLNGTFEGSQHRGSLVNGITYTPDSTDSDAQRNSLRMYPFIVGNYCYIAAPGITSHADTGKPVLTLYRAPIAPLTTNSPLTFTAMTLSGNDLYGLAQTGTTVAFTSKGVSNVSTENPMILTTAGVSSDWAHFGVMHNGCGVDATNSKVKLILGAEFYTSTVSASGYSYWNFSVTVNLLTGGFTIDNGRRAPLTVASDLTVTGNIRADNTTLSSTVFPLARWDAECYMTHVNGWRFSASHHHAYGVYLDTWSAVNDQLSIFDSMATWATERTEISRVAINGKFGGASKDGLAGIAITYMAIYGYNKTDNGLWKRTYDTGGTVPYSTSIPGLYPGAPAVNVDAVEMAHARSSIAYQANGGWSIERGGTVLSKTYLTGSAGYGSSASITAANLEAIRSAIQSDLGVTPNDSYVMLYVPSNTAHPALAVFHWMDTFTNGYYTRRVAFYPVTLTQRTGAVAMSVLGLRIASYTIGVDGNDYSFTRKEHNSSAIMQMSSGNLLYLLNASYITNVRGWAYYESFQLHFDVVNLSWSALQYVPHDDIWNANGRLVVPKYGLVSLSVDTSGSAVIGTHYGWNPTNITSAISQGTCVIYSSQVLNGSQVYFTETEPYINAGLACTMPVTSLDLATLYPGQWTNRKFYLYVVTTASGGKFLTYNYVAKTTLEADTANQTYIGYVTTDSAKITNVVVNRVTKLGYFQELLDHINDPTAHGLTAVSKTAISLPLVSNKAPRYELKSGLFEEVCNSWTRFSHWPTDYSSAAYPAEVDAWSYSAADDTVTCTMNTAGYSGFVSLDAVGDFTFDTVVGVKATSADADNDAITLIIGFVTVDGVQHDISVVRSCSLEAHIKVSTMFGVYYDYMLPDQTTIKTVDTTTGGEVTTGNWRGRFARIRVTRTGDTYVVKSTVNSLTNNWSTVTDADFVFSMTFTLNDLAILNKFKGSTRYGYGAVSQNTATYINYQRPDEDGKNYYATAIEAIKACYYAERLTIISGTVANGGVLPIPAGYTKSQCRFFLMPDVATLGSGAGKGIKTLNLTYDPTTLAVTSSIVRTDGVTYSMQAAYIVAAVSDFKLFK